MIGLRLEKYLFLARKALVYERVNGTQALARTIVRRALREFRRGFGMSRFRRQGRVDLPEQRYDVIFLIGCWEGESKRYRVYNLVEGLQALGRRVHVMPFSSVGLLAREEIRAEVVVVFRAPHDPALAVDAFLTRAKASGVKVVFDIDDLVFEPDILDQIDGLRHLNEQQKALYVDGIRRYRAFLLAADLVTVPTEYLRARVEALGKPAVVIPNSINRVQKEVAERIAETSTAPRKEIRIGYFSGSRTHQADFARCADALFEVMQGHSHIRFRVVGYLELDSRWEELADRVERIPFLPYRDMLSRLAECDINLAPLDEGSAFCHGKSELKFFEAGLVGVPTVASPTDTFLRAIENGLDGFIAATSDEWRDALMRLVRSPKLRAAVGAKARETALRRYQAPNAARIAETAYGLSPLAADDRCANTDARRLRIAWIVPELIIGGGGHRNILRTAYFLSRFGHEVSLYFTGTHREASAINRDIQDHFYPIECPVHVFNGAIGPCDVVFATHWSTVDAALSTRGVAREIVYFVQDFEPAFAPMGTEYILIENTYRQGLYHITSGPWCERILRRDFDAEADHFQFPVDRTIYHPRPRTKTNRNILFFAKPEMPRRCFDLGILALRVFHRLYPDVEIILFGSKVAARQHYDFPVTVRGVLPSLGDLATLYANADAGLVFSTTNPSLIPYEMMACGLPVIDLARGDNALNYGGREDIALLVDPRPERMAEQIAALIDDTADRAARRERGLAFVDTFPSEEDMARRIEWLILRRLGLASSSVSADSSTA